MTLEYSGPGSNKVKLKSLHTGPIGQAFRKRFLGERGKHQTLLDEARWGPTMMTASSEWHNVGSNDVEVPVWPSVSVNSDTSSRNSCAYDPSRQLGGSSDNVSKSRSRTVASSGFNSPFGNERSHSFLLTKLDWLEMKEMSISWHQKSKG